MIRICLVGAGGIANTHAAALKQVDGARITGVYDVNYERAKQLASACGAEAFADFEDCLAAGDAVYLLTPPSTRKKLVLLAAASKRHIFMEKPIATRMEDALEMEQACREAGITTAVGFNMRFRPGYRKLKEAVESGQLGDIISMWSHRMDETWAGSGWRTDPAYVCGMTIESLSHDIDMFRWLGGDVKNVASFVGNTRTDLPGYDDNANVLLTMESGRSAVIQASLSSYLGVNSRGITGTKGTAILSGSGIWNFDRFRLRTSSMATPSDEALDDPLDVRSYVEINRHFIECIQEGNPADVSVSDGLKALEATLAIHKSHQLQRVVSLEG